VRVAFFTFLVCLSFSGCATRDTGAGQKLVNEQVSYNAYAVDDSIRLGRFDLAKKYSGQTVRLIAPPEKRAVIRAIYED
jgi:hypothetical protein